MTVRLVRRSLGILAVAGWLLFFYLSVTTLAVGATSKGDVFQVDWHVYWAGAHDLLSRELYRVPLDAGGRTLSTTEFNLPPLSAGLTVPLLGLPVILGGYVWQAIAAASIAVASVAALSVCRVPRSLVYAGLVAGSLALSLLYVEGLHLGTNNYVVLAMLAGFTWLYLRGADAPAGVILGIAIAVKLWPAVLLLVALRERRMRVVAWVVGVVVVQAVVLFGWLGIDAVPAFVTNLRTEIPATGYLIGPTAIPGLRDLWNGGLGLVLGVAILALPLRGAAGIGVAILAGLCAIPNLWIHYGPTVLFAVALIAGALVRRTHRPEELDHDEHQRADQQDVAKDQHDQG
jgi:hypothetical protein